MAQMENWLESKRSNAENKTYPWWRVVLVNQGACTTRRCGCKSRKREQSSGAECECQRCTNVTGSPQQQDVAEEEGKEEEEKDDYRLYITNSYTCFCFLSETHHYILRGLEPLGKTILCQELISSLQPWSSEVYRLVTGCSGQMAGYKSGPQPFLHR